MQAHVLHSCSTYREWSKKPTSKNHANCQLNTKRRSSPAQHPAQGWKDPVCDGPGGRRGELLHARCWGQGQSSPGALTVPWGSGGPGALHLWCTPQHHPGNPTALWVAQQGLLSIWILIFSPFSTCFHAHPKSKRASQPMNPKGTQL